MPSFKTRLEWDQRRQDAARAALEAGSVGGIVETSTNYSIGDTDTSIFVDASGGARTITLPTLSGRGLKIKKVDATYNAVTVSGAANIDGSSSLIIDRPDDCAELVGGSSEWYLV